MKSIEGGTVTPLRIDMTFETAFGIYAMLLLDGEKEGREKARQSLLAEGRLMDATNAALVKLVKARDEISEKQMDLAASAGLLYAAIEELITDMEAAMSFREQKSKEIHK